MFFIINPIAGGEDNIKFCQYFFQSLKEDCSFYVLSKRGEAKEISKNLSTKEQLIIAVGGDGTVNEIASSLVNSNATLAIIPRGSGNGLARTLHIPLKKKKEILNYLLNHKIIQIDTGNINDQTFFCTAGIGFEGKIAHLFDKKENNKRGFQQYLQLIIQQAITYKPVHAKIRIDDKIIDDDFSSICFANANQWGNNGFIAPTAKLTDGLLNVTLIKPFPITNLGVIVTALLGGYIDMIPHYVTTYKAKEIEIIEISNPEGHIDGEPYFIQPKTKISINKQSLNVAVPIDFQEQSVRKLDEIELKINNLNNAILSSIQNSSVPTHTIELKKLLFNQLKKLLRR